MSLEPGLQVQTSSGGADGAPATRPTVLIVDDHAVNRELLQAYLKHEDYRVIEADDGFRALELVERERVDLVLLDVMMPRLNGFATCARLKQMPRSLFLPVILVTSLDDQDSRNRGLSAGADDFLSRPVDRHELLLRVGAFLKLRQQEAQIQQHLKHLRRVQSLKDALVLFICNDLRSPLASIDGCLQLLQSELPTSSVAYLLEEVASASAASGRVHMVLDDVLDVRLLEDGELKLVAEVAPLRALVMAAAATHAVAARARKVEVKISADGDLQALLDRALVRRCVETFIANAIRRSSRGAAVDVDVKREAAGMTIEVSDRGATIPDEVKRRLFDKFTSVAGLSAATHRGVGVGMHLVKLVAALHGGSASVVDRAGGGSVFRLVIALAPAA